MLTMFVRAMVLYVLVVVVMRLMGKRQIGQLQPYELAVTVMIADLAAAPVSDVAIPLSYGILPMAALALIEALVSIITFKSEKARGIITGLPSILVKDGRIDEKELSKLCLNLNDLLEQIRAGGIMDVTEVGTAVLETSGQMSLFPISQKRPLTPRDMNIETPHETTPVTLVLDGRIQQQNLQLHDIDEQWFIKTLKRMGIQDYKKLLICSINAQNVISAQEKETGALHYMPVKPKGGAS